MAVTPINVSAPASHTTPEPSRPDVQVPPAPAPHVLRFLVGVGHVTRPDLNDLSVLQVLHPVLRLAIAYDHRGHSSWRLDTDRGVLELRDPQNNVRYVATADLSVEEIAAVRFLSAVTHVPGGSERRTNDWRAHVMTQLGQMVPLYDFDGDPVNPAGAAKFYQTYVTLN